MTSTTALGRLTATEFKLYLRDGVGLAIGIALPIVLLVIFGSIPSFNQPKDGDFGGLTLLETFVPILATFVLAMFALQMMPPVLAGYREKGILRRMRTTPAGPVRVLSAQLIVGLGASAVAVIALLVVARAAYGVALPAQVGGFVLTVVLAAVALDAIGLFIAAASPSTRAANAFGAIGFYLLTFFAGLWYPIPAMPRLLQHISHATPLGAAVEAIQDASLGHFPHPLQLVTLALYAVVFGAAAARLFRWE